nr:uncharacterized protein LOC113816112 [Penaeus vannamei]
MPPECTMLEVDEHFGWPWNVNTTFSGRYCLVYTQSLEDGNTPLEAPAARVGPAMAAAARSFLLPVRDLHSSSCTSEDMMASLEATMRKGGKRPRHVDCLEEKELDGGDIAYIVVLSILGALMLGGAFADWLIGENQELREGPLRFLLVFSVSSNLKKIFQINNKPSPSVISCLQGMRVLSMTWIVWGHAAGVKFSVTKNSIGQYRLLTSKVIDQTLVNATYSVDTFFFMSGLLVVYGVMREQQRSGRVNWILYYIHRIIRSRVAAGSEQEGGETRSPGNGTTPKVPGGISALYRGIVYLLVETRLLISHQSRGVAFSSRAKAKGLPGA